MAMTRKNEFSIARKFDSKGNAVSEFPQPPASFVAARTFVLNDASLSSAAAGRAQLFKLCATAAIFEKVKLFKQLITKRHRDFGGILAAKGCISLKDAHSGIAA
jgi:hypothetical protein